MDRDIRNLGQKKAESIMVKVGEPTNSELSEGSPALRFVSGKGLFWYVKYGNIVYKQQFADRNQENVMATSSSSGWSISIDVDHDDLDGLLDDDHTQYLLIDGTRSMTGDLNVDGGDISISDTAHNVVGKSLTVSAGDTTAGTTNNIAGGVLTFEGGKGKGSGAGGDIIFKTANAGGSGSSLNALATALTISDDLSSTFAGAITGTTIDATTDFTVGSTVITDDSIVMTPSANDTITIAGATNGALSITTVDTAAAAANIQITADGTFEVDATTITLDSSGDIVLDAAGNEIYFKDNTSLSHTFQTSTGHITMINSGQLDNSVVGRLHLTGIGNGVHIMNPPAFNTSDGMGHGDEVLTYDHFPLRWKAPTSGSYIGQHIAGGEADYKNNYTMIGFSTTSSKYANHAADFVLTS